MADTPFNLLELPGVFEPGVYASVVYDSDPGLAAHRIGFALVRVRTPYPSFRMATQIGNIAQILDGAIDFYNKSPQEQGEALGKATVSVASDVAIAVATDGLRNLATLRKAEKAAEVAEHVRDAERAAAAAVHKPSLERASRGKNHLVPDPHAEGHHTTFRRNPDGEISNFTEWKDNPQNPTGFDEAKRVDVTGGSHWNAQMQQDVPTPHVHDKNAVGGVRSARADEIPIRLKPGK